MAEAFVVSRSGVYLSVPVGVDAIGHEDDPATLKHQARCLHIRAIAGHIAERVRAHQVFGVGVLLFLAQLLDLPRRAGVVEAATLASILASPMHSVTAPAFSACFAESRRLRLVPVDIQCRAALMRFALVNPEIDDSRESDDALLRPSTPTWVRTGVLQQLMRARRLVLHLPPVIRDKIKPQPHTLEHLVQSMHADAHFAFVRARVGKWWRDPALGVVALVVERVGWCFKDLPLFAALGQLRFWRMLGRPHGVCGASASLVYMGAAQPGGTTSPITCGVRFFCGS